MEHSYNITQNPEQLATIGNFKADIVVSSPGRVNLIGEHTDYNKGFVMPTAIDKTITFYLKANGSANHCEFTSLNYSSFFTLNLHDPKLDGAEWTRYIVGVVEEIKKLGRELQGFDCLMISDLPMGAGISSSAALECGLAFGLNALFDLGLSRLEMVKLSQMAEHHYVGTKCGIMDQFASMMSRDGHLIKLDCQSLKPEMLPFDIAPYTLLLLNTNVEHSLASSEYNTRREECEKGVAILNEHFKNKDIGSLRDVDLDQLKVCKDQMDAIIYKRCSYVLEENKRVNDASEALKKKDLKSFGALMYGSHDGLQHDYEVSCPELDFMTEYSRDKDFILGCRMMGGGFGGCTINLIHEDHVEDYVAEISKAYYDRFNIRMTSFTTRPANGTTLLAD